MELQQSQDANSIREPESVRAMGWMILLIFVIVEFTFAANALRVFSRHTLLEHLTTLIAFQISLLVLWVCFWRLWTRNVIHRYRGKYWDHSRLYICMVCLSAFLMVFMEPEIARAAGNLTR